MEKREPIIIRFAPELTRDYVLSKVSEEEIFAKYGVRVSEGMLRSPLRFDRNPTCRFYRSRSGRLVFHDFSGHFTGDCFDFAMRVSRKTYPEVLRDIASSFSLGSTVRVPKTEVVIGPKSICEIHIRPGTWDEMHLSWWEDYGVDIATLNKFKVVPIEQVWLNRYIYYNRDFTKKNEVVFGYRFGGVDYKIYFPMREKTRFLHNNPDILQGWNQLPEKGKFVIITKSMKDVICLSTFGIPSIAPMSETSMVSDSILEDLSERFEKTFALYDRDKTGKIALLNLRSRGVTPLMMPKGTTKDFSDLCKLDYSHAKGLVEHFIKSITS